MADIDIISCLYRFTALSDRCNARTVSVCEVYVIGDDKNRIDEKKPPRGCYRFAIPLQDNIIQVTASSNCVQHPVVCGLNPTSLAKNNAITHRQADVDIGFICESWLTEKHTDDLFSITGYRLIRFDRPK